MIKLYRLYGGRAGEYGQYWGLELRDGGLSYRYDAAVLDEWNTLERGTALLVPPGVFLYEGQVSRQRHYLGGGWQVFIPREIVQKLVEIQPFKLLRAGRATLQKRVDDIDRLQNSMMNRLDKERDKQLQTRAFRNGSEMGWLPLKTRQVIRGIFPKGE